MVRNRFTIPAKSAGIGRTDGDKKLTIILPCAGIGRRMKSYGPKPLIQLNSTHTVLSRQIAILRKLYPKSEIIVVVGYEADKIIATLDKKIKIVENEKFEDSNVTRSISMALRVRSTNNVLVVYGDLVFNDLAVNGVVGNGSRVIVDVNNMLDEEEVGVNVVSGLAVHFSYGLPVKWAQIVFLQNKELELFEKIAAKPENRRKYGFEILNDVIDAGGLLLALQPAGMQIVEIDSSKDLEPARGIK